MMAIITTHAIQIDFQAVAATMGNVCTPRAVQERLKKIKRAGLEAMGANLTPAVTSPKKGGKPSKNPALTLHANENAGPKPKANLKSQGETDEGIHGTLAEDSEATTELLTDIGSDFDNVAGIPATGGVKPEFKTEDTNDDAPVVQAGKAKAQKNTAGGKRLTKAQKAKQDNEKNVDDVTEAGKAKAKPERKTAKASGAGKSKKAKAGSEPNPDDGAAAVTAEKGMKRKRENVDEGAKGEEEN